MGKFDGILICSDVDGTFWRGGGGEENCAAVKYFCENGGHFCFATGRNIPHIKECGFTDIINAPCCLLNGSIIYDYNREEVLKEEQLHYTLNDFLKAINPCCDKIIEFTIFEKENTFFDLHNIPKDLLDIHPYKILCRFETCENADEFVSCASGIEFLKSQSYISKSWEVGVEFNPVNATKGTAIEFIKRHLKNIHTSIGIGDYENDIPLLKCADIGVAVENAIQSVINIADYVVKPCTESAIKDLIEKIENGIIKK